MANESSGLPPTAAGSGQPTDSLDILLTRPIPSEVPPPPSERYRFVQFHAKGGLGSVWRAFDSELGREVALKEIVGPRADDAIARKRFLLEAEITGRLEHPGIVPVYSLGHDAAGRPFYTMRLISGQSLRQALVEYFAPATVPTSSEQRLVFRSFVQRLVTVCYTIDYAHSKGVLHRDLKPDNIMLGTHGEALVIDWGLAKVIGAPDDLAPLAFPETALTKSGVVLGTPGFLAPEQARGQTVSPATDVYGLGGILYAILTGRPPIVAETFLQIAEQTAAGLIPLPHTLRSDVPPALAAICMKALAVQPEQRYPFAAALANDLERWLASEPVAVYRPPLRARCARWLRHPLVAGAGGALVAALLVAAGLIGWPTPPQPVAPAPAPTAVVPVAPDWRANAQMSRAVLTQALRLPASPQRTALVEAILPAVTDWLAQAGTEEVAEVAATQAALGDWHLANGQPDQALTHWQAANAAYERVPDLAQVALAQAQLQRRWADLHRGAQRWAPAEELYRTARIRLELARAHPTDGPAARLELVGVLTALGAVHQAQKQVDAALRCYSDAALEFAGPDRTPESTLALARLLRTHAQLLRSQQRAAEAIPLLTRARDGLKELVGGQSTLTDATEELVQVWLDLASSEQANRQPAARRAALEAALAAQKQLLEQHPQNATYARTLAKVNVRLAEALFEQREYDAARERINAVQQQRTRWLEQTPQDGELAYEMTQTDHLLAQVCRQQNRYAEAATALQAQVSGLQKLLTQQPNQRAWSLELGWAQNLLGLTLSDLNQLDAAGAAFRAAGATVEPLMQHATDWHEATLLAGGIRCNWAQTLVRQNQTAPALAVILPAKNWLQRLLTADGNHRQARMFMRNTLWTSARIHFALEQYAESAADWDRAETLMQEPLPLNYRLPQALAWVRIGRANEAVAAVERVVNRYPSPARYYDAACVLALAATSAEAEPRGARAVQLLRQACAAGYRDLTHLQADPDLTALRGRPDYRQFLSDLARTERAPAPRSAP